MPRTPCGDLAQDLVAHHVRGPPRTEAVGLLGVGADGSVLGKCVASTVRRRPGPTARVGTEGGYVSVHNRRFRRTPRVRGAVLLAAAVLGVAGCSGSTEGSPTAVESAAASQGSAEGSGSAAASTSADSAEAGLWDPCALPESAITGTGLDPASKQPGIAKVDFGDAGWEICSWKASAGWYSLTIFSGEPTLDEVKARDDFTDFTSTTVGSHPAVQYRTTGAGSDLSCDVAVGLEQGTVMFSVVARPSVGAKEDPCAVVNRHASGLVSYLPEK
ncbi:DUF3558 domain-containing protein [Nocardia cyriacigeorgica]|uniref:DUF3558 domain-containing protein n=1 Tax=Nocardia cyriacigeorgica TaxID=135487 RepID=UPI0024555732|nr:DUF3558 domain-containing protein [Nocardia cyriacigeorgica]